MFSTSESISVILSSFFPSILGIYADKIYSKFDDTIFQFKRHLESSQKEYILEDNSASINASEHFEYKVGIFLSAWEYHGFKYEENFQNYCNHRINFYCYSYRNSVCFRI